MCRVVCIVLYVYLGGEDKNVDLISSLKMNATNWIVFCCVYIAMTGRLYVISNLFLIVHMEFKIFLLIQMMLYSVSRYAYLSTYIINFQNQND